jgi:hypothetical protein
MPAGAYQRAKSHCRKGHRYDVKNTYWDGWGKRHCRRCHVVAQRRYIERSYTSLVADEPPGLVNGLNERSTPHRASDLQGQP